MNKHGGDGRDDSGKSAPPPEDLWPLLTEFGFSLRSWWIGTCSSLDLTPVQGLALRTLDPDAPLAMSALADTLTCDASNVTGVVDKLEARGLIARQSIENDRRVKMLIVTEKGREVRRQLLARAAQPPDEITSMPKEAQCQMAAGLRAFLTRLRDRPTPAAPPKGD
ncbi:MAG: MarR family transcriptional regulator [Deltaproteobacteria bacterium]|nr:MarR family transcriptional regulator [Deltaproteobacteria bacterium]